MTKSTSLPKLVRGRQTNDVAFLARMPAGIPGDLNRIWSPTLVAPEVQDPDVPVTQYGVPVKVAASGGMSPIGAGDTAADVYGVIVRPYPLQATTATGYSGAVDLGPASAIPPTKGTIDVAQVCAMTVKLNGDAAAAKGAPAYIWIAASTGTHVQGGWEAAADGGNTIAGSATFRGPADANGNVEIIFNNARTGLPS